MIKINPKFVYDENDKKTGIMLTPKDFDKIIDKLEYIEDYEYLKKREQENKKEKMIPFEIAFARALKKK